MAWGPTNPCRCIRINIIHLFPRMAFNSSAFGDKLRALDSSQPSITKLSQYVQYQHQYVEQIADAWLQVFVRSSSEHQISLIYL